MTAKRRDPAVDLVTLVTSAIKMDTVLSRSISLSNEMLLHLQLVDSMIGSTPDSVIQFYLQHSLEEFNRKNQILQDQILDLSNIIRSN